MSPMRPSRVCARPGCPRLVTVGARCPEHQRAHEKASPARRRRQTTEQRKLYGSRFWRNLALRVRQEEMICRLCKEEGRTSPAEVCDHIDGDFRNCERSNLRAICRECDRKLSAQQHARKRNEATLARTHPPGLCTVVRRGSGSSEARCTTGAH